jgi:tetratricopeptide (TPR) repeat protein
MKTGDAGSRFARAASCAAGLAMLCATAAADVPGVITKNDNTKIQGMLRWLPASKEYVVTQGPASLRVAASQVQSVQVARPPELDSAAQLVRSGQHAAAIPVLEKVLRDYSMLEHDVTAAALLAESYLKMKQPEKAVEMCDIVIRVNPTAGVSGGLVEVYWEALLQAGRDATLRAQLGKAVESGSRAVAARAQIKRGDIDMKNGKFQDALVDGYLRTALLFGDVKQTVPEALYKSLQCFEQLEQHSHAEQMRKRLLAEFPDDPYTQRLKSGT